MGRTQHRLKPPGTYFVTIDAWGGRHLFKGEISEILADQIIQSRGRGYYLLHEFCVMPNHLHVLVTPAVDSSLERTIQMIKGGSSYRIGQQRRFHRLWQDGYQDWRCRSEKDSRAYSEYIRQNPVKAGLVAKAEDWPYSSANPKYSQFLDPCPQGLKAWKGRRPRMSTLKGRPATKLYES